ncbi:MAG: hypothetical protein WBG54_07230 [Acidobacteriaceae bacterium]
MERSCRLIDHYLPPGEGFVLESLVATTYQIDFEFFEEELLAAALGVRSSVSRLKAFRSELERKLQKVEVSVLYDLGGCDSLARLSPRIDAIPVAFRKLHSKISLLMWVREDRVDGAPPDRRMRLIVGSANLTRQGFRRNYECVVSVDYGGRNSTPRTLLTTAIGLVQQIAAESRIPQLSRQLAAFAAQASLFPDGNAGPDDPVALVAATEVVSAIRDSWAAMSNKAPETVTVVSPFWTEGSTAPEALFHLFQQLGSPASLEMVCCGERSADGKSWLPVFDSSLAVDLKKRIGSRLYLRPALPDAGRQDSSITVADIGDEMEEKELATRLEAVNSNGEEVQRSLHAKMILVDGTAGSVLYAGSSNCTRRGLGLGGPSNFEAGLVYRLTSRQRKQVSGLLTLAGPATEVQSGKAPTTVQPSSEEEKSIPSFLSEVVASGSIVTIRFRETIPADLVLLMPIPARTGDSCFWLLYRTDLHSEPSAADVTVDLAACQRCNDRLEPLTADPSGQQILPHVFVEVRWNEHSATFPVRFDDKTRLPLLLVGRKPTEGDLIEYFLFGKEPEEWEEGSGLPGQEFNGPSADAPIDTRRILAYFIRRFVQAIPGIEAEIRRAGYSRASLDAVLRGPTSPLELAERAYASLKQIPASDEPAKTPTSVGFQLTEILAALLRSQALVADSGLQECFPPVVARCREMLDTLVSKHEELQAEGFRLYQQRILGGAR